MLLKLSTGSCGQTQRRSSPPCGEKRPSLILAVRSAGISSTDETLPAADCSIFFPSLLFYDLTIRRHLLSVVCPPHPPPFTVLFPPSQRRRSPAFSLVIFGADWREIFFFFFFLLPRFWIRPFFWPRAAVDPNLIRSSMTAKSVLPL